MRNLLNYYYKLEPIEIHQKKDFYTFYVENKNYKLIEKNLPDIEQAYKVALEFYSKGIYINKPKKTLLDTWQIQHKNRLYHLIEYDKVMDNKITLNEIIKFQKIINNHQINSLNDNSDWGFLWSAKLDYFEYQMNQIGIKYKLLRETFTYYIGLAELGVSLFNSVYDRTYPLTVQHKRLKQKSTLYDIYDPFNMIKDIKVRDASEYFKDLYVKMDIEKEVISYLTLEPLTKYEKIMFFIRMIYPSFYFDKFEEIMNSKMDEKEIENIIKKTRNYHFLLKRIYKSLSDEINMPYIEWFNQLLQLRL